jgi:hypothetical protein
MRITMIPGLCSNEYCYTGGTFCESCFSSFLLHGCTPDRPCITGVADDGKEEMTLVLQYQGVETSIALTDANRDALAYGGWQGWPAFVAARTKQHDVTDAS